MEPIYPGYFYDIFIIFLLLTGILFSLSVLFPAKYIQVFDPFKTPPKIALPFFILPFHFLKVKLPDTLAGVIMLILVLFLFFLPWIDRSKPIPLYKRPLVFLVSIMILLFLIITGIFGFYLK
jgi:quinol-cytochrome oxidoreductase complex cytochrome b subunit